MTFDEYQKKVTTTGYYPKEIELAYLGLGMGEAGEIQNEIKKIYRDEKGKLTPKRAVKIVDEMSDLLWYLANMAEAIGWSLDTIARYNVKKILKKYKDHKRGIDY